LSLGDYKRRLASTPLTEKSQAQAGLGMSEAEPIKVTSEQAESSPGTAEAAPVDLKSSEQPAQQTAVRREVSGSSIEDTVMKDDEEPEYSPPDALPPDAANEPEPPSKHIGMLQPPQVSIPAEVTNVLAQLAQFRR